MLSGVRFRQIIYKLVILPNGHAKKLMGGIEGEIELEGDEPLAVEAR